jgi:hypothetical protein
MPVCGNLWAHFTKGVKKAMDIIKKKIERIIITGSLDEYKQADTYCREHGFRVIQTNPCLSDKKHRGKVTSFEIVAEKDKSAA